MRSRRCTLANWRALLNWRSTSIETPPGKPGRKTPPSPSTWRETVDARAAVLAEHESEIEALRQAFEQTLGEIEDDQMVLAAIAEDVAARSQAHVERINARAAAFYERADGLWRRIGLALARRLPHAEDFAWVEPEPPDAEEESLFDSARDYLDQIEIYKARTGRPKGRRGNDNGGAP